MMLLSSNSSTIQGENNNDDVKMKSIKNGNSVMISSVNSSNYNLMTTFPIA